MNNTSEMNSTKLESTSLKPSNAGRLQSIVFAIGLILFVSMFVFAIYWMGTSRSRFESESERVRQEVQENFRDKMN